MAHLTTQSSTGDFLSAENSEVRDINHELKTVVSIELINLASNDQFGCMSRPKDLETVRL